MEHLAIAVLGLALVVEKVFSVIAQRASARERRELYNRLQAGTLPDYAAHRKYVEEPVVSGRVSEWESGRASVEDLTHLEDDLPESALVEAQSKFNSLMG